jgi:signal transduction histidine kinase
MVRRRRAGGQVVHFHFSGQTAGPRRGVRRRGALRDGPSRQLRLKPEACYADGMGVDTAPQNGALAETAAGLSQQMQAHLVWMARALEARWRSIERGFRQRLKALGYTAQQIASLVEITPGAAGILLAGGRPLEDFLEQVRYRARRLAKLDLTPARVVAALQEYDRLVEEAGRSAFGERGRDVRWARNQLHFLAILALNDAYYQVREAESRTFYELFRAQTESHSLEQLWERCLGILTRFSGAAEAGIFLLEEDGAWVAAAGLKEWKGLKLPPAAGSVKILSRPRVLTAGSRDAGAMLGPGWAGKYVSVWSVPMSSAGSLRGVLQFAFTRSYEWLPRELSLLEDAAARCWEAAEKARMTEELARREQQIRALAEHMVEIEEAERRRISRELHDEAGQSLLYVRLQLEMLEQQVSGKEGPVAAKLRELRQMVEHSILEIRRLIAALSPAILEQMGLAAALRQLVGRFRQMHSAEVAVHIPRRLELPKKVEIIVYRLVQEALNNIAKYSLASHVNLSLETADGVLNLLVEDDGVGFDVEEAFSRPDRYGLSGLKERVALLGGVLEVESVKQTAPEERWKAGKRQAEAFHGTRIRVSLPLATAPGTSEKTSGRRGTVQKPASHRRKHSGQA